MQALQTDLFLMMQNMSQSERVLFHLQKYGKITNLECHELYGIRHAPSVIRDVRKRLFKEGNKYKIENVHKEGKDRFGNKTNYDEYTYVCT